ncbi:MAG: UDP-3-O-(3-hydroxymyristoyl)glucosamine N-acyltransferase [Candidatus Puniceispirillales bacterium]
MADPRFYPDLKPLTVTAIVDLVRGELLRGHGHDEATGINAAANAGKGDVCFVSQEKAAESLSANAGAICLVTPDLAGKLPDAVIAIAVPDPKAALGLVMRAMLPEETPPAGVDPSASIAATASLGEGCSIGENVVIRDGVELGPGCIIGPGVHIGRGCVLGEGVRVHAQASINYAVIGNRAEIGASTVIGQIGFGVGRDQGNVILPHLGLVRIGDECNIGAATTIDRGFLEDTVIGARVMIDNLCQIAHNVQVADGTVICAQTGIAGSTQIGRNNVFGAQCGVADNLVIGDGNMFAARSGVTKNIGNGQVMGGFPAVPINEFRRQVASIRRLGRKTNHGE